MCGIAGYIGKQTLNKTLIEKTLFLMKNRGPDYQSYSIAKTGNIFICLLHSRLSIIDLDKRSNQPFTIGDYTLVFNGEIYNFIELKKDLEKDNIKFQTESDTEVLIQSYIKHGQNCVQYFEGMWAFAIYDRKKKILFLSRDRFAEKPLYYFQTADGFYFASEIKFIKSLSNYSFTINYKKLLRFMVYGYRTINKTDDTFFNEIREVAFASNLTVSKNLNVVHAKYWQPTYTPQSMSINEAIEQTRNLLLESVRIRLRSDVPLAFCLSGGVDSASIVSIAAKIFGCEVATYSIIDSDERYNEYENIKRTVNDISCKNTLIHLDKKNTLIQLERLIQYHDAPLATISYYIHSLLSKKISEDRYRVVFSGTGADELFTGYYDHFIQHLYELRNTEDYDKHLADWKKYIQPVIRNPFLRDPEYYFYNPKRREHVYLNNDIFSDCLLTDFKEEFKEKQYCNSLLRNRMLNELFHEGTRPILHEDDLNSMMHSIENRSPYLDKKLFDFAYSIPSCYLIQKGYGKYILRESVKNILNDHVRLDRRKKGFNASIQSLFNLKLKNSKEYFLDNSPIFKLVDKNKIESILKQNFFTNSYSNFMFSFINIKIFLEQNDKSI